MLPALLAGALHSSAQLSAAAAAATSRLGVLACSRRLLSALAQAVAAEPVPRAQLAGQPTHETHPELLKANELVPGIKASEFEARRAALARLMPQGSVAVVPSASTAFVTGVIPFPYRQDADFNYLTGIQQQAVAIIQSPPRPSSSSHSSSTSGSSGSSSQGARFTLFIEPPDTDRERWDGAWLGSAAARDTFGADAVHPVGELPHRLQQIAAGASSVLYDFDRASAFQHRAIRGALHDAIGAGRTLQLRGALHQLRAVKSQGEVALMAASAHVAARALKGCIAASYPGVNEGALAAHFEYQCRLSGAQRMAYPPVVAGGPDTCTIHYSRNDKPVRDGQLVLIDAGCELHGYCSDVTRTWPVHGRFSTPQAEVYEMVLGVRARCLEACTPGSSIARVHQLSVALLSQGLRDLGILRGMSVGAIMAGHYKDFYIHSVGHYLGLDVHDTHTVGQQRQLQPGMVIALEPGLYVPDSPRFGHFRGIGVRIEDDVLITEQGPQVLSSAVPVELRKVEELVGTSDALRQQLGRQQCTAL